MLFGLLGSFAQEAKIPSISAEMKVWLRTKVFPFRFVLSKDRSWYQNDAFWVQLQVSYDF